MNKANLAKRLLQKLLKQQSDGVPIEAQGFLSHPQDGQELPSITHQIGRKRPQFVEDSLKGWKEIK